MVNKALRIVLYSIFTISLLFVVPFNNIYASTQSTIAPTFSSSTSQWNGHLHITNFSDGTNNQASSTLAFTFDDDYYGIVYFDGYGPSNQLIANYASVYIAGGYGEYRYSYYQNAIINITSVTINIVNVVKPGSSVDLSQVVTLLTAIESDTTAIDNVLNTTLSQIRLVLSELIESNGYLEILTKIREYNFPIESLSAISNFIYYNLNNIEDLYYLSNWTYPLFKLNQGDNMFRFYANNNEKYIFILMANKNMRASVINNYIQFNYGSFTAQNISSSFYLDGTYTRFIKIIYTNDSGNNVDVIMTNKSSGIYYIPIFFDQYKEDNIYNVSDEFALNYQLSNNLLSNINLIANGTNASSAASSQSDQANSQLQQDSNTLFQQEDSFKQNMNSAMQNIDTTFTLNNFGNSFMTSAQWVRTQYETLTNNTPFASLITFSLLVGLALIVVGKVYK